MTINFRCEHCGKKVEAPEAAGGKRGKCPYCKQSNYIPLPTSDEDIIPLADDDDEVAQRVKAEHDAMHQDFDLIKEMGGPDVSPPLEHQENLQPEDLYHLVINYCLDISQSRLDQAETHVAKLKKVKRTGVTAVDDFLNGKADDEPIRHIPAKLREAFLKQLKEALR